MTKESKFNICELETSYLFNDEIQDLEARVQRKISDGLQYSCMHWASHLSFDSDPVDMKVSAELDRFFTGPQPLYWLEVSSLMREIPGSILALRQIKACIKACVSSHFVVYWLIGRPTQKFQDQHKRRCYPSC